MSNKSFLSKSDIRTDVQNNLTYTAADFAFLGDLATKDSIDSGDIICVPFVDLPLLNSGHEKPF